MIDPAWLTFFLQRLLDPMLVAPAALVGLVSTASHWAILAGAAVGAGFVLITTAGSVPAIWIGACSAAMVWAVVGYRIKLLLRG